MSSPTELFHYKHIKQSYTQSIVKTNFCINPLLRNFVMKTLFMFGMTHIFYMNQINKKRNCLTDRTFKTKFL